jgi:branched-chain amino acid transport system ATP-binding protein
MASHHDAPPTLEIEGLTKYFGGLRAVGDFDLAVQHGELAGLIGPNGAGKTTVFNMISGLYVPSGGAIRFEGVSTLGMEPHEITQLGIGRTFQNIRLFPALSVLDNVRIAYHPHAGYGMFDAILRNGRFFQKEREITERAQDFLAIFKLEKIQNEQASSLPYGEQRRVEIARALAGNPRLLLLDDGTDPLHPRPLRPDHPAHRAPDAGRHGDLRAHHGHGLRRGHRARDAQGDPGQPQGDRSVPG